MVRPGGAAPPPGAGAEDFVMLVTEGGASRRDRRLCVALGGGVFAVALVAFAYVPWLAGPVLSVALVLAAAFVARSLLLSALAPLIKAVPPGPSGAPPSGAFIIPCLNERPSLERTVPALTALHYAGELRFCYVCEQASRDGTFEYIRDRSERDGRVVLIEKTTPPGGRGAAVAYGLKHAPPSDFVGFLDADHTLDQASLDELGRTFGGAYAPVAVQGVCATSNESPTPLARLLTVERRWLEKVELRANPRLGGMSQFGGGQGFFRRSLFEEPGLRIDDSMILDDTDLSIQMALRGHRVAFNPRIETRSRTPETVVEFLDQRLRWARGWVQFARKYLLEPLRRPGVPLPLRMDLLRLAMTPFAGALLFLGFAAALVGLTVSWGLLATAYAALAGLFWPLLVGFCPFLAGAWPDRARDAPLVLVGIPLLHYCYALVLAVAVVDALVLRRPVRYAKTAKPA
jgi:cellulose synthase/poly-beta-1,6-N-acetylglucosamine synthase-like glycosyltransferase